MTQPKTIVPLVTPQQLAGAPGLAPAAHLTYHNGPVLTNVEVVLIFWGADWNQPDQSSLIPQLNQFFDFILTSAHIDLLGEYSVPGNAIGHGSRTGTFTITDTEPGGGTGQVTDAQIQQALQNWISNGTISPTTNNTLYFVYLPPDVVSVMSDGSQSCQVYCGYHNHISSSIFYAVEPFITCDGCSFGQILDSLTKVSSHELCEAITDPALNAWWDDSSGEEIGDICNSVVQQFGGYTIQAEWSNGANACIFSAAVKHAWNWANQGTPQGVSLGSGVGVITVMDTNTSPQRPHVFIRGNDGNLWVNWWDGSAWHWADQGTPQGVSLGSGVGVVTVMDTNTSQQRPHVFVQGNDGNLWVNWWDGSAWHWANQGTPQGVSLGNRVGATTVMDTNTSQQRPYVFIQGNDGNLWVNWWDGSAWNWANQGTPQGISLSNGVGAITVMDTNTSPQRPYVFIQGNDGNLWVNWWDGSAWNWANQGTPPGVSLGNGVGVITVMDTNTSPQRPYVFIQGTDGNLWVNWWDGSAWNWANQGTPTGISLGSGVGVITVMDTNTSPQRPYIFVQGSDGNLWVNWWDGSAWNWANQGTPQGVSLGNGVGVITVMDTNTASQRPYVFVQGNDGNLWVNWWS